MGRKSNEQIKYENSTPEEKTVIQLERMNSNLDRLISTNITANRKQEQYLDLIAECAVLQVRIMNQEDVATDDYKNTLRQKLNFIKKGQS